MNIHFVGLYKIFKGIYDRHPDVSAFFLSN